MRQILPLLALLLLATGAKAQKWYTREGHIRFHSETPVEEITAHNRQATGMLDGANGQVVMKVLIKSFEFDIALMQEHFNENYMHSDKHPKATFEGMIQDFEPSMLTEAGTRQVTVSGELTMHGTTKPLSTEATLEVSSDNINGSTEFQVRPTEFGIEPPAKKVADVIDVSVDMPFEPFRR